MNQRTNALVQHDFLASNLATHLPYDFFQLVCVVHKSVYPTTVDRTDQVPKKQIIIVIVRELRMTSSKDPFSVSVFLFFIYTSALRRCASFCRFYQHHNTVALLSQYQKKKQLSFRQKQFFVFITKEKNESRHI